MQSLSRRSFVAVASGLAAGTALPVVASAQESDSKDAADEKKPERVPVEAPYEGGYERPSFKPSWKKPQINRTLAQDFVVYAHSDLPMVKKLLQREPALLNATLDWGNGDWETGLGGASHMGRRDIVEFLLSQGARIDIFCAAMLGLVDVVRTFLTLEPKLIDARGPHGFNLHFHAQVGQEQAQDVLEYLQSVKPVELRPVPFLKKTPKKPADGAK